MFDNLHPLSTAFIAYIIFPPLSSSFRLVFPNVFNNDLELFLKLSTLFGLLFNLLDGAHDGRVIAVEPLSDVVVRNVDHLAAQIDRHMARIGEITRSLGANEVGMAYLVVLLDFVLHGFDGDLLQRTGREVVLEQRFHVGKRDVGVSERGHLRNDLRYGAFELTHVRARYFRDIHLYIFGNI